jgi:hypothetical protein
VKLLTTKPASETMLADLIREGDMGSVGRSDPFAAHDKCPLADHVGAFEAFLDEEGYNAFAKAQTAGRVRKALVDGCKFPRLSAWSRRCCPHGCRSGGRGGRGRSRRPAATSSPRRRRPVCWA